MRRGTGCEEATIPPPRSVQGDIAATLQNMTEKVTFILKQKYHRENLLIFLD